MTDDQVSPESSSEGPPAGTQRNAVRERYTRLATEAADGNEPDCCAEGASCEPRVPGYSESDLNAVKAGSELNLGCGNPTAIADLQAGETVLDLGAGGGFDCFLAARQVGPTGHVIGVDMTPAMVETARENAAANNASNVEFRLGEIEHLPVSDESVDVILSNCVINLSPDKPSVFEEAYRVLRPGGRLSVSDVVRTAELPDQLRSDPSSVAACIGGAASATALEAMLTAAGFMDVTIELAHDSEQSIRDWDEDLDLSQYIAAATIEARKPPTEANR